LGSFIDGRLDYNNRWNRKGYEIRLRRPYTVTEINNIGEIKHQHEEFVRNIYFYEQDSIYENLRYDFLDNDAWFGHSFDIVPGYLKNSTEMILSARFNNLNYHDRPMGVSKDSLYEFHDRKTFLMGITFLKSNFIKGRRIYGYGRTEDVPYGFQMSVTGGYQDAEFGENRFYTGIHFANSVYDIDKGYWYFKVAVGGFWNKKKMEDGVFVFTQRFFSKYIEWKEYGIRHFLNINYTYGINRLKEETLTINRRQNLGGLRHTGMHGKQRFTANFETLLFTPKRLASFQLALLGFADLAFLADDFSNHVEKALGSRTNLYGGFGIGLRLVNEKLVFSNIELKIGIYPLIPEGDNGFMIDVSSYPEARFDNFTNVRPEVIPFR